MGGRGASYNSRGKQTPHSLQSLLDKNNKKIDELSKENIKLYNQSGGFSGGTSDKLHRKWLDNHEKIIQYKDQNREINSKLSKLKEGKTKKHKTFVNGFGEATHRYVTSTTYDRVQQRQDREIFRRLNNKYGK